MAGSTGLEPATSDVTGRRSNQTELTPQAAIRMCSLLRGLVYTDFNFARKNFFKKSYKSMISADSTRPSSTKSRAMDASRLPRGSDADPGLITRHP